MQRQPKDCSRHCKVQWILKTRNTFNRYFKNGKRKNVKERRRRQVSSYQTSIISNQKHHFSQKPLLRNFLSIRNIFSQKHFLSKCSAKSQIDLVLAVQAAANALLRKPAKKKAKEDEKPRKRLKGDKGKKEDRESAQ